MSSAGLRPISAIHGVAKEHSGLPRKVCIQKGCKQIQEKFHLIRDGDLVLDVDCHLRGWTQVSVEKQDPNGLVIGIDLLASAPVEGAQMVTGDVTDSHSQQQILQILKKA